MTDIMIDMT